MQRIAIYGFGRIGRTLLRSAYSTGLFEPAIICDIAPIGELAALLAVDTNYGLWNRSVEVDGDDFVIDGKRVRYINTREALPRWEELGIDLIVDCTGRAVTRAGAQPHLDNGAKRVLVSGPSKTLDDCDAVLLPGINLDSFEPEKHQIISLASCTTNALAPVVKVLRESVGLDYGFFSAVHAYTNTQSLTDQPMKDRRDSWAAAENVIPSSSGAAKALKFIWPDLDITGKAYRVPVRTGSIVELNVVIPRDTTAEELNDLVRKAAADDQLTGILGVLEDEWASSRIIGEPRSSIVDLPLTKVQGKRLASIAVWYDNEAGFSMRLAETAALLASTT